MVQSRKLRPPAAELDIMGLAEKMFSRTTSACPIRSDCKTESDRRYFDSLFEAEWEVFVIKRDNEKGSFDWFHDMLRIGEYYKQWSMKRSLGVLLLSS